VAFVKEVTADVRIGIPVGKTDAASGEDLQSLGREIALPVR
jgi:hypothetical protein